MIRLTQFGGAPLLLNADLIQYVETLPDTFITLANGQRLVVAEPMDEVLRRVMIYQQAKHLAPPPARSAGVFWRRRASNKSETFVMPGISGRRPDAKRSRAGAIGCKKRLRIEGVHPHHPARKPWQNRPIRKKLPSGAPAPAKKSILGKLLVLGLVLLVVGVECTVAYFCIPTTSNAAAAGAIKPPADGKKGETDSAGESHDDGMVEVDLKEFSVTIFQPASNSTLRIDFHLHGIVAKDKKDRFKDLIEKNQARFREQVNVIVRSAEMADLSDPSLGLIKRTILAKTTAILGEPLLKEVLITDYAWLEN